MKRVSAAFLTLLAGALMLTSVVAHAEKKKRKKVAQSVTAPEKRRPTGKRTQAGPKASERDGQAEARLIDIYKLVGQAKTREALAKAEGLVQDHPNFQLAHLVYGDLLAAHARPLTTLGDIPASLARSAGPVLAELRDESHMRLTGKAVRAYDR